MKKIFKKIIEMNIIILYCVTLFCHVVWSYVMVAMLNRFEIEFSQDVANSLDLSSNFVDDGFLIDSLCVLLEETVFRWGPMVLFFAFLWFISKFIKNDLMLRIKEAGIVIIVLVSSIIFGLAHGNVFNILIQGVSGLIFFMFYLRALYKRKTKGILSKCQIKPLVSSAFYHMLSNYALALL